MWAFPDNRPPGVITAAAHSRSGHGGMDCPRLPETAALICKAAPAMRESFFEAALNAIES